MANKTYKVANEDGVQFAGRFGLAVEVGQEVELDLGIQEAETAVLAAGWLEEPEKKGKGK